jgi:type II secretory pathway component PulJ
MSMPKDQIQGEMAEAWRTYLESLQTAMNKLDKDINEAAEMAGICTDEWCEATEHVIDELANSLFSISEPRWANPEDTKKLKKLKKRVYDLYADYKGVYKAARA